MPTILSYGDSALLVNFEQRIDRNIHWQVVTLYDSLSKRQDIQYMIPAYCSLTVVYDAGKVSGSDLEEYIQESAFEIEEHAPRSHAQLHKIPVCYDAEFGPDLKELSSLLSKSEEDIIKAHLQSDFYVYMVGFLPGFAYMGDMPEAFNCPRKGTPRIKVPAGSVGLAGRQTAVYPFESPGGWQLIGQCPVKMFDVTRDRPSLLQAGDHVKFVQISKQEFEDMNQA
jgi:inhibitor of KinA